MRKLVIAVLTFVASASAGQMVIQAPGPRTAAPLGIDAPQQTVLAILCTETEPNELPSNASPISVPVSCTGNASFTDAHGITINYGNGVSAGVQDLFVFSIGSSTRVNIALSWNDTAADLDLFLFRPNGSDLEIVTGSTTAGSAPESISRTLSPGTYYIGISAFSGGSSYTLNVAQTSSSGCTDDTTTACLNNGRFRVRATYDTGSQNGNGGAVRLTSDTGYLWFFGNSNVEMVVKILEACSFNNRFWVFAGGLTDVGVSLNVTDTQTGTTKTYTNTRGTAFKPIQDTDAFATCNATPCTYALSPGSQSFGSGGGTGSVNMTTSSGCNWSASSDSSWITVTSGGSGSGNGAINYTVAPNGGAARSGTISAGGQSATISQTGGSPSCNYLVSPPSASYGQSGGSGSVTVTVGSGCAWSAASNAAWITITSGFSGSGNGSVGYSVAANSGAARNGSMTIAGQTVTVSQAAAPPPSYDGTWSGPTSQGKTLSFTISNNAFTSWSLSWHATGGCTVDGTTTTTLNTPQPINGSSFTLTASGPTSISINGSFSSNNNASGSFTVNYSQPFPACSASGSGTFTVTKP